MPPQAPPGPPQGMPPPGGPGGPGMKGGGLFKGKETYGEELKEAKAIKSGKITPEDYAKGEKAEESKMKKYAKGGAVRSRDGIAQRGKTRGMVVGMKRGGKC